MKLTLKRVQEIFDEDVNADFTGDNFLKGCMIIAKYVDITKDEIVVAAGHDIVYCLDVESAMEAGMTEEDFLALSKLNWIIENENQLACFI